MFGRKSKSPVLGGEPFPPGLPERVLPPIPPIEANIAHDVVGESHYGLARYMKRAPADPEGWKRRDFLVILEPDPSNAYDSRAIKVGIVIDHDRDRGSVLVEQVGHIARGRTGTWHKWIRQNDAARVTAWGNGVGKRGRFGMKFDGHKAAVRFVGADVSVTWQR